MPLVCYSLMFGSVVTLALVSYPPLLEHMRRYIRRRVEEARSNLDAMFFDLSHHKLQRLYTVAPVALGLVGWLMSRLWFIGLIGMGIGVVIPKLLILYMHRARRKKFHAQLVDSLLLLSSCLRAGLSMLQAFTVVAEEMPPPLSQEFGLLLKELRMGVNLEEAMTHLLARMPSDDAHLFVTAVLIARETGGDVTAIFMQLVETLRERKKIRERIKTLTFMARMQGIVMALLPFVFAYVVYTMDRNHFAFFLSDPFGKMLLAAVVAMQAFGTLLFMRFSRSPL